MQLRWLCGCIVLITFFQQVTAQTVFTDTWQPLDYGDSVRMRIPHQKANNNLDAIFFDNQYFIAFRSAPNHFPGKKVHLHILRSADRVHWQLDTTVFVGADLREPRFVVFKNRLYLYFFQGGKFPFSFSPRKIWCMSLSKTHWNNATDIQLNGYVPWRLHSFKDTLFLSAYFGKNLYRYSHVGSLRIFWSIDGINFSKISEIPQIETKGCEEGEFVFDSLGNLWAVVRLEGSGSYLVFTEKNNISNWDEKVFSKYKYDSSLLFWHEKELYLIARQNLKVQKGRIWKNSGNDKFIANQATEVEIPTRCQRKRNLLKFSFSKKRTAIFHINQKEKSIEFVRDFPSTGDNSFAAIVPLPDGSYWLLNYSSNIFGHKKNWIRGQLGRTFIYQTRIIIKNPSENLPNYK